MLSPLDSLHILSFRILLSLVVVGIILLIKKNRVWLSVFRDSKIGPLMILASLVLSFNWGFYIWAVNRGSALEASLGYFISPLVSVIMGMVFYRERLKALQWAAVAFAFTGVLILTMLSGVLPWISLIIAFSFSFYGLLKKRNPITALESLGAETLISAPIGLLLFFFSSRGGSLFFSGVQGLAYFGSLPFYAWIALPLVGLASAYPIYGFSEGAKLLPLSALGFIQFISPSIQFFIALFIFKENFPVHNFAAFAFIWVAVIFYILSLKAPRGQPAPSPSRGK